MAITEEYLEAVFGLFLAITYYLVKLKVQTPFIDEIFHLRQCGKYCDLQFYEWDNKITTPPGLYILGFIYGKALSFLGGDYCKNYHVLRSLNLIGGALFMPYMLHKLKTRNTWVINITSLPLLFTYYFLFYTDVWSTALLVCSLSLVQDSTIAKCAISGLAAFFSLWFRQTNIVWIFFITVLVIERKAGISLNFKAYDIKLFVLECFNSWANVLPFAANGVFFVGFLVINKGITFGDKSNHEVTLHIVQVFYCLTFITIFTWPVWLSRSKLMRYVRFSLFDHYGLNVLLTVASLFTIKYIIENFTVVHPFLLADNRHYTFYIYKRIFLLNYSSYFLAPIYHFAIWNTVTCLASANNNPSLGWVSVLAYFFSICLTVIPSPLFEPRYYIVPLVIFKIYCSPEVDDLFWDKRDNFNYRQILDFAWLNTVNIVTMAVFFTYEFRWLSEPTNIQRIIW